jgi:hypothetical protein
MFGLLNRWLTLLRKVHAAQQGLEARLGSQGVMSADLTSMDKAPTS